MAQNTTFGVLKLTLHPTSYDWQFVPEAGGTFTDGGSESCHGLIAPPPLPGPVPDGTAPVITKLRLAPRPIRRKSAFRYELSEAAKVKFTIKRKAKGRYRSVGELPSSRPRGQTNGGSAPRSGRVGCARGPSRPAFGRSTPATAPPPRRSASELCGGHVDIALCEDYVLHAGTGTPRRVTLLASGRDRGARGHARCGRRCSTAARRRTSGASRRSRPCSGDCAYAGTNPTRSAAASCTVAAARRGAHPAVLHAAAAGADDEAGPRASPRVDAPRREDGEVDTARASMLRIKALLPGDQTTADSSSALLLLAAGALLALVLSADRRCRSRRGR